GGVRHRGRVHLPVGAHLPRAGRRSRLAVREHAAVRGHPVVRARVCVAQGRAQLARARAMTTDRPASGPLAGIAAAKSTALVVPGSTAVSEPIVLRNDLWSPADPAAYNGGQPADTTHLAEFGATMEGRRDDARWSGLLEII